MANTECIVDCHAHIIDPQRFPVTGKKGYQPRIDERGTREAFCAVLDDDGVSNGVLVQLSGYGTDNSANLDAIKSYPGRFKAIAVVDRQTGKQTAAWPMRIAGGNFPMAIDPAARHVLVAFRDPAKLGAFAMDDGSLIASPDICGDADDLFVDAKRRRVYISCGEGFLDVFDSADRGYRRIARIATVAGAAWGRGECGVPGVFCLADDRPLAGPDPVSANR